MKCQRCKKQDATLHLTTVVDGAVRKLHLCEVCAEKAGVSLEGPVSVTDLLIGLAGGQLPGSGGEVKQTSRTQEAVLSCPECGLDLTQFQKRSRLGCSACYVAFRMALEPVMQAVHRHDRHRGKVPTGHCTPADSEVHLDDLRQQLAAAVRAEQYEEAARLRDRLRVLRLASGSAALPEGGTAES